MVNQGDFGSLKAIRTYYNSMKRREVPDSYVANELANRISSLGAASPTYKYSDVQDIPLDLSSRQRRRLSLTEDIKPKFVPETPIPSDGRSHDFSSDLHSGHSDAPSRLPHLDVARALKSELVELEGRKEDAAGCDDSHNHRSATLLSSSALPNSKLPPKKRRLRQLSQSLALPESAVTLGAPGVMSSQPESRDDRVESSDCRRMETRVFHPDVVDTGRNINSGSPSSEVKPSRAKVVSESLPSSSSLHAVAARDEDGDLPLHIAVAQGSKDVVRRLVPVMSHCGVPIDSYNNIRQTALHLAVISNQPHMVDLLLEAGASAVVCDRKGNNAVHLAIKYKTFTCLKHILTNSRIPLDLDARNYEGLTALHLGVQLSQRDAILALLANGASANATDGTNGRTPLYYAAEANDCDAATALLRHGSDLGIASYSGCTPLQIAVARSFHDMTDILEKSLGQMAAVNE